MSETKTSGKIGSISMSIILGSLAFGFLSCFAGLIYLIVCMCGF